MTACTHCQRGPEGVEGHLDLFIHTMGAHEMQLKCRTCGAVWVRRHAGAGFTWTERKVAEPGAGVPIQPRREPARR